MLFVVRRILLVGNWQVFTVPTVCELVTVVVQLTLLLSCCGLGSSAVRLESLLCVLSGNHSLIRHKYV